MKRSTSVFGFVAALSAAFGLSYAFSNRLDAGAGAEPPKWDYVSEVVEANFVQAKLTEWSQARWELVAINSSESIVEQGEKPQLRVDKYRLTAKRPIK